ncbi:MAG: HDIG domain-containing protein [Myxococcales bacterium]|nr:HDIG domain-containing protein [Myxococcales bacterium]
MLRTRVRVGPVAGVVLSIVFAALFAATSLAELFVPALAPAYHESVVVALRTPYEARDVPGPAGTLQRMYARTVVPPRTRLDPHNEQHRSAMAFEAQRRPLTVPRLLSAFVLYLFPCGVLTTYFRRYGHPRARLLRSQVGIFGLVLAVLVVAKAWLLFTALPAFWIPVAATALWVALSFDRRTALIVDLTASFFVTSCLGFDLTLLAVFATRGVTATVLFVNRRHARQMLLAGTVAGLAACVAYVAMAILLEGKVALVDDLRRGLESNLLACGGGGVVSGLLGRLFREPAELALGHVSRDRLLDLTDIERPLLRKMAREAPGSWEHSRAMANLAEAASAAIGADSLLTRVGAYYHDLGKTVQPKYFVENLAPGERSPHDELEPEVSADAIMAHVVMGTKLLRDGGVPEPVVEFAYTHHGTQLVEYFWAKYQGRAGQKALHKAHFRYPGMKPMTKETAILMLVDSIEAASRTVQPPEHEKFVEMIQRVVFTKLASGQLDDSGLTVQDLRVLADRMASTLVNMYHGRIKYPWQRERDKEAPAAGERPSGLATPVPDSDAAPVARAAVPPPAAAAVAEPAGASASTLPSAGDTGSAPSPESERPSGARERSQARAARRATSPPDPAAGT